MGLSEHLSAPLKQVIAHVALLLNWNGIDEVYT